MTRAITAAAVLILLAPAARGRPPGASAVGTTDTAAPFVESSFPLPATLELAPTAIVASDARIELLFGRPAPSVRVRCRRRRAPCEGELLARGSGTSLELDATGIGPLLITVELVSPAIEIRGSGLTMELVGALEAPAGTELSTSSSWEAADGAWTGSAGASAREAPDTGTESEVEDRSEDDGADDREEDEREKATERGEPPSGDEAPTLPGPEKLESEPPAPPAGPRIVASESTISATAVRDLTIEAENSQILLEDSTGPLALTLVGGTAEVHHHQGPVTTTESGSDISFLELEGALRLAANGGRVGINGGTGAVEGELRDADLLVWDRSGSIRILAEDSTLDGRTLHRGTTVQLQGSTVVATLDDIDGPVTARLERSELQGSSWRGTVALTGGDGTRVDLVDLSGTATVDVSGGSRLTLEGLDGQLRLEVREASAEIGAATQVEVQAEQAELQLRGVERVVRILLDGGTLDLDLAGERGSPTLDLRGESVAEVSMSAPCAVQVLRHGELFDDRIEVFGCELVLPGRPRSRARSYGGRSLSKLSVDLSDEASIQVDALP